MQASDLPALFAFCPEGFEAISEGLQKPVVTSRLQVCLGPDQLSSLFEAIFPMPLQEMRVRTVVGSQWR